MCMPPESQVQPPHAYRDGGCEVSLLMSYRDLLRHQLRIDEEPRNRPYDDATGRELKPGMMLIGKLTIGIGRNLTDNGVNDDEMALMHENDIDEAERTARRLLPDFAELSDVRKYVVCNMAFNLGYERLKGFRKALLAIHEKRWADTADEMLDSKWAKVDVPERAKRLANAMRNDRI